MRSLLQHRGLSLSFKTLQGPFDQRPCNLELPPAGDDVREFLVERSAIEFEGHNLVRSLEFFGSLPGILMVSQDLIPGLLKLLSGQISIRDFMLFQLSNIHQIRMLAGLPEIETKATEADLRPNVKAILTTQLEWLQVRSTKQGVKRAAKMVYDKMQTIDDF